MRKKMEWMWLIGWEVVRRCDCFCMKLYQEVKWKFRANEKVH